MDKDTRADELGPEEGLTQPGTKEPKDTERRTDPTGGPGNVSVDEPTDAALDVDDQDDFQG